ncbi:MAG: AAA family ATPase [Clostridiales bacterium]|nr:AAA family ATPase [Clostridiales bacterium]
MSRETVSQAEMGEKRTAPIRGMTVDRATFQQVSIEQLSLVNFFYGKNGAGKTSIARAIEADEGVEWSAGYGASDFVLHVFSQDFITDHFSSCGSLQGVFTVNKTNIEIQRRSEAKAAERRELQEEYSAVVAELRERQSAPAKLLASFQDECFRKTKDLRGDFSEALTGKKTKKNFAEALLGEEVPKKHDLVRLKRRCDTAFDQTAREYPLFARASAASSYGKLPGRDLLGQVVVSSSDTPFASFWKALNASDWVRSGHEHYGKQANGRCPYCSRELPAQFEAEITACFDEQYRQDIDSIARFRRAYEGETASIIRTLKGNLSDVLPSIDLTEYRAKLTLLERSIELNNQRLAEKLREPSKIVSLEDTDSLFIEIGNLIDSINREIRANNDVVRGRRASKEQCRADIMQHFAFLLYDDIERYLSEKSDLEYAAAECSRRAEQLKKRIRSTEAELARLNAQTVNTSDAMDAINRMLAESGFQGFRLRARAGMEHTYEVVRENGAVAENLSEGERSFIAFLYFYQMVCGSQRKGERRDKIVVIDDPVSGMDATSLYLVSGIVRRMIDCCRDSADGSEQRASGSLIRQIFILTHNVSFHREITYRQMQHYSTTSFYLIRKRGNRSAVKLCVRQRAGAPGEWENYNPVQSSYEALWEELRDVQTVNAAKNVMRRILSYYFLQICGYDSEALRKRLLETEENRQRFLVPSGDDRTDTANYEMALSLLSGIDGAGSMKDEPDYVEDTDDIDAYRRIFRLIFEALGQTQHYDMMMGTRPTV